MIDEKDREFPIETGGAVGHAFIAYEDLNPNLAVKSTLYFDIPYDENLEYIKKAGSAGFEPAT